MDEITSKIISDINERLGWANRSFEKLKRDITDQYEVQDNFWSFLTAFQFSWFYFNRFLQEITPNLSKAKRIELSKKIINEWKANQLAEDERLSWDILQNLRNQDAHRDPVYAKYEIKLVELKDYNDEILADFDGTPFSADVGEVYVEFNEKGMKLNI